MRVREYEWVKTLHQWCWVRDHVVRTEAELDSVLRGCAARRHRGEIVTDKIPICEDIV